MACFAQVVKGKSSLPAVLVAADIPTMRALIGCLVVISSLSCAGREYRTYPDNGSMQYLDCSVQAVGGNLDATGVTMHYKGKLADSVESLGPLEAKASKRGVKKNDALRELQLAAQKKQADGVYDVLVVADADGETMTASGIAFRFKR